MRVKQLGEPILRSICAHIDREEINMPPVQEAINTMKSVLDGVKNISDKNGNAISAPQVGSPFRVILLRLEGEFCTMINPQYRFLSEEMFAFEEECFSFYYLRGIVQRHVTVTVEYLDEQGDMQTKTLSGEESALVQHEIDHLDGVMFIDKIEANDSLSSIDSTYKDDQSQLMLTRQLAEYMAG